MSEIVPAGSSEALSLLKAYDALSSYVSHGALADDTQFDEEFSELASLVPMSAIRPIARAYRVLVLPEADLDALLAGSPVALRPREFGSWTRSKDAARRLVRSRFLRMDDGMATLVVAKPVERDDVVVDVQEVYRQLGFDCGDVEEWGLYASWEAEVILRQRGEHLTVMPGDVVLSYRSGDPDAVRPIAGEGAWSDADEDFTDIEDVADEQPFRGDGLWVVGLADGSEATVSWNVRQASWDVSGPGPAPAP